MPSGRPLQRTVVVGAGSAGAVVAARVAEAGQPVLLLEAGSDHASAGTPDQVSSPEFLAACADERFIWPDLVARRTPSQAPRRYLRGRGVGGSSAINAMVGMWAPGWEYDAWFDLAAGPAGPRPSWWSSRARLQEEIGRRFWLSRPARSDWSPIENALATAALDQGHRWCEDYHAAGRAGVGVGPAALCLRDGRRVSVNDAYLEAVRDHPSFAVRGGAEVARVLLEDRRAVGVQLRDGECIEAGRVVLCAGALHSPALLLHSGVEGQAIGANLAEHPSAPLTLVLAPQGRLSLAAHPLVSSVLRYSSGLLGDRHPQLAEPHRDGFADMQIMAIAAVGADEAGRSVAVVQAAVMRSFSRGRVQADARGVPVVDFHLLSDERDRVRLRDGLRRTVALVRHRAVGAMLDAVLLDDLGGEPAQLDALLEGDEAALDDWLARHTGDYVHACGTCRMGRAADPDTVVDPADGAVHGYQGLHVIDASVFPWVPRANTHLSTVLMAELLSVGLLN